MKNRSFIGQFVFHDFGLFSWLSRGSSATLSIYSNAFLTDIIHFPVNHLLVWASKFLNALLISTITPSQSPPPTPIEADRVVPNHHHTFKNKSPRSIPSMQIHSISFPAQTPSHHPIMHAINPPHIPTLKISPL